MLPMKPVEFKEILKRRSLAEDFRLLVNQAMLIERSHALKAKPYERTDARTGHANGFKDKTLTTRLKRCQKVSVPPLNRLV